MTDSVINLLPISIIRTSDNMYLIESAKVKECPQPSKDSKHTDWDGIYENRICHQSNASEFKRVAEYFDEIKNTNDYDALLFARIILILYHTVPSYDGACTLPDISETLFDAPKPSATPRHTRGFKGTKDRRPTGKSAGFLDIRSVLMDNKNLDRLLQKLWAFRHDAILILKEWGLDTESLGALIKEETPPKSFPIKLRYESIPSGEKTQISKKFNEEIMPIMVGCSWEDVRIAARTYYALGLEEHAELRAAVCRVMYLVNDKASALLWLNDLSHISQENLTKIIVFLIELGLHQNKIDEEILTLFSTLDFNVEKEFFPKWTYIILEALAQGYKPQSMMEYIKLSLKFYKRGNFVKHNTLDITPLECEACDADIIITMVNKAKIGRGAALNLWHSCCTLNGLDKVLQDALEHGFTKKQLKFYAEFFVYPHHWHDHEYPIYEKWESFKNVLPQVRESIKSVEEDYLDKWFDVFTDCVDLYKDTVEATFLDSLQFAEKLARSPFLRDSESANSFSKFMDLKDFGVLEQFLSVSDANFIVLDKACKRKNDGYIISWGLSVLIEMEPEFTFYAFLNAPKKLVKILKIIGPMSWESRRNVIKDLRAHPVFMADYDELLSEPSKIISFINQQDISKQYNPVPRALKDHVEGKKTLSDAQVERHLSKLNENLTAFKLQALEVCGEEFLKGHFKTAVNNNNIRHALKLYHSLDKDESKRIFKRFLDSYFVHGHTRYRDEHALTLNWITKHKNLNLDLWTQGLEGFQKDGIFITLEKDPLEALKLGTYVGSCLGLGGIYTESAVAIVLDMNKQVLFARNSEGHVIARQVVAIADDDQLVAFEIYPNSASKKLKRLFVDYNKKLAAALGFPLFDWNKEDADYEISLILAKDWWDDGAWSYKKKKNTEQK